MIDIIDKEKCCGCYACNNICPKNCIEMQVDNEGFWYPYIDKKKCIDCGLCEKVCPQLVEKVDLNYLKKAYAIKSKNNYERENSSSGGVFSLIAKYILDKNGVVFGAGFDEYFNLKHMEIKEISDLRYVRGSKYVQSSINNTYNIAKEYLEKGVLVLFSGTQCQIKGLNLFLNKQYDNLITVEVICHGVPSPKVFLKYIEEKKIQYRSNINKILFRNKKISWNEFMFTIEFENKKVYEKKFFNDIYMKGFLENLYLRPSCYKCNSKNFTSGSDLSLADYWGVENIHEKFYDEKGVSLVICNSEKGYKLLNEISSTFNCIETDLDYAIKHNPCIVKAIKYNLNRRMFFKGINSKNMSKNIKRYITITKYQKIKAKINRVIKGNI
ncbi:Coenzyme F420 hydrogenase/dehydrogenase, beta subunit C-terminal domain [Clostridium perfringens]|uniref:Coenzyme F420 hydrogenase/dehydrogenase, beta subunit C-terminal domain n=2 Tax=Clostridium perfringens TaxID=1502 RepID=UPI0011586759|nr:Coenzyme F420 hydrogenase/dehydrogenase, beta subunit C-terminal domain [Clostridium perfringens]MDM0689107.1 Coenzyme F420 hydrogenase/dehydrogenase, beta subunit C-terminal domain [Clostridium perfringens]MDU3376667.1 Coenzyme F420 hydrogenase/dehydrogenase, beta subunit C-terminal domain [Clostridium perfringens]MDU3535901.1 Coenzyme F420 hydrogenase/dehydrogenase, beta subunit C-terminal domain [Clostridium perfringens]HAT4114054.1 4Fe-4S dicluster domain-containing protein [Clostridium 